MSVSNTLKAFCSNAREFEELRAQQDKIRKPLQETKKISESIFKENLNVGDKMRYVSGNTEYIIGVKRKQTYPSCKSDIVERISLLWNDPAELKKGLLENSAQDSDITYAIVSHFCNEVMEKPSEKTHIEFVESPKKIDENLPDLPNLYHDAAQALCYSKNELKMNREEFKPKIAEIKMKRSEAEKEMAIELASASESMRKLSLIDNAGNTQSYYLRLKKPRKKPQKKISHKKFKQALTEIIEQTVSQNSTIESSLNMFCTLQNRDVIVEALRRKLEELEQSTNWIEQPRVTLDRVRKPKNTDTNSS